jgi:hypothetical protein
LGLYLKNGHDHFFSKYLTTHKSWSFSHRILGITPCWCGKSYWCFWDPYHSLLQDKNGLQILIDLEQTWH